MSESRKTLFCVICSYLFLTRFLPCTNVSAQVNTAGEYSPDRLLLPINELTTLNMSAHNSAYTSNINAGGGKGLASGSKASGSAYTPSWMAEQDI